MVLLLLLLLFSPPLVLYFPPLHSLFFPKALANLYICLYDTRFITTFRGHVGAVYQCCFSADSRQLVSSSKDTTLKVWDVRTQKLKMDLPGHRDEVFAVDWAPDGEKVCSGGKDKVVKLWRN